MAINRAVIGHDYGAPHHEGVPGLFEPYVATAYSDGTCDFEKLPVYKGTAAQALSIAQTRFNEVCAAHDESTHVPQLKAAE
ncbi:MAG: hypothetical protein KBE09_01195 [Candidatus Pacebacteria bacterium]|nr:hypothetical protein [Candidatus Paceibacterota bacterium]